MQRVELYQAGHAAFSMSSEVGRNICAPQPSLRTNLNISYSPLRRTLQSECGSRQVRSTVLPARSASRNTTSPFFPCLELALIVIFSLWAKSTVCCNLDRITGENIAIILIDRWRCLLYTSPSPRD